MNEKVPIPSRFFMNNILRLREDKSDPQPKNIFKILKAHLIYRVSFFVVPVSGLHANMTHKSIPADIRRANGVNDSLIRLSVGLEEVEDLIADLDQAFVKINELKVATQQQLRSQSA